MTQIDTMLFGLIYGIISGVFDTLFDLVPTNDADLDKIPVVNTTMMCILFDHMLLC